MNNQRLPASRPAIVLASVAIGCLVIGAIWPWFSGPNDPVGQLPSPWLLWLTVLAAGAVLVAVITHRRRRWLVAAAVVTMAAALAARYTADPGWMCWDGMDGDGNMVGDCEQDLWSPAPIVFALGVALSLVAAVTATRVAALRQRSSLSATP